MDKDLTIKTLSQVLLNLWDNWGGENKAAVDAVSEAQELLKELGYVAPEGDRLTRAGADLLKQE